jgi:hypothetical protein
MFKSKTSLFTVQAGMFRSEVSMSKEQGKHA